MPGGSSRDARYVGLEVRVGEEEEEEEEEEVSCQVKQLLLVALAEAGLNGLLTPPTTKSIEAASRVLFCWLSPE